MKKSETMDLYEGLNEISPQMIEEGKLQENCQCGYQV